MLSKKQLLFILILLVLLDFAALDDLTTGLEPNFVGEWVIVILSIPAFVYLFYNLFKKSK